MYSRDWVSWVIIEVLNSNIGFVFLSLLPCQYMIWKLPYWLLSYSCFWGDLEQKHSGQSIHPSPYLDFTQALPRLSFNFFGYVLQ